MENPFEEILNQLSEVKSMIADLTELVHTKKTFLKKEFYSKKEFANAIGKSISFVDQERRKGRLESKKIGGTVGIPTSQLKIYSTGKV